MAIKPSGVNETDHSRKVVTVKPRTECGERNTGTNKEKKTL